MEKTNDSLSPLTTTDIPYIDGESEIMNANPEESDDNRNTNGTKPGTVGQAVVPPPAEDFVMSITGKYSFPFLLVSSVIQLSIYLNKLYQDSAAVGKYYEERNLYCCLISAFCLFLPAVIYIIYTVAAYVKDQVEVHSKEVGTKFVHGLLLVPWQIKSRVEVLQFSAQRVCQRRKLTSNEMAEKSLLERQAMVLEFFEEFYAGLVQMLLQLYIIISSLDEETEYKALTGEIIASGLTLMSMIFAVRRKDDGILTGVLSIIGWMSIMISRAICIALAATIIRGGIVLVCILHGVFISTWVTSIAIKTYYKESPTVDFPGKRKFALFCLIFAVFGLPSLTYWPIMFELKKHKRPLIFLFILLLENLLFVALWLVLQEKKEWLKHDYVLVFLAAGFFLFGVLFILFYICCKPKYTDQVVYHDMKASNADNFGMYFEFCDVAFKLTRKQDFETRLKEIRQQRIVPR